MNLTLNGRPRPNGVIRYPASPSLNPPSYLQSRQSGSSPIEHTCGGFLFGNCVDQEQIGQSQRNEVFDKARVIQHSHSQYANKFLHPPSKAMEEEPKRKISLSICRSENNFRTPQKKSVQINTNTNEQSRNKRVKTYAGHPQPNANLPRSTSNEHRPYLVNMHQMKSSLKPSTIPSSHNSAKKSNLSASRKLKLSLTSNFKSQIQSFPADERQGFGESLERGNLDQLYLMRESEPRGSQQVIDHSFMTQKLANIYGEINEGPPSNIVQYNRIMGTDVWKLKTNPPPAQEIPKQEKSSSFQWNINEQQPSHNEPSSELQVSQPSQQIIPLREIGGERRWIGDYAPTIKTFNNSQSKEDQESVVIGRGPRGNQNPFPPITFQRGSVKDYYKEPSSQQIKRACTSFGAEDASSTEHEGTDKFKQWLSHPIEEDVSQMDN